MLTTLLALALLAPPSADSTRLLVVVTAGARGMVDAVDERTGAPRRGGLARVATVVDSLRRVLPGRVLVLDAGDATTGSLLVEEHRALGTEPPPVIDALNGIGYDALTPGPWDFSAGAGALRRAFAAASSRVVAANLVALPVDTVAFPASVLLQRGGLRLAVSGVLTQGVAALVGDSLAGAFAVRPAGAAAARALAPLRTQADVRVVLAAMPLVAAPAAGWPDGALDLAALPEAPDLVLWSAAQPGPSDTTVGATRFVRVPPASEAMLVLEWRGDAAPGRAPALTRQVVSLASVVPAPRLLRRLAAPLAETRRWAQAPVAETAGGYEATAVRVEPTALAGFVQGTWMRRTGATLAASPLLLRGLPRGDVSRGDLLALTGEDDILKAVRISGAQLRAFLEWNAAVISVDDRGAVFADTARAREADQVGGATYVIDLGLPVGNRIRDLAVGGVPVQPGDSFAMAIAGRRLRGSGAGSLLAGAPIVYDRGEHLGAVLLDAATTRHRLEPARDLRSEWRLEPVGLANAVRDAFGLAMIPIDRRPTARDSILLRALVVPSFGGALEAAPAAWAGGARVGGAPALAATLDHLEAECRCPTVRLATGGALGGSAAAAATHGRASIDLLNRMRVQAAALGPADLLWSLDTLRQRLAEARFPVLAANAIDSATGATIAWLRPWGELRAGARRVAVVGHLSREAKAGAAAPRLPGLVIGLGATQLRDAVRAARATRPDLLLVLADAPMQCDASGCGGEGADLVRALAADSVDHVVTRPAAGRGSGATVVVVDLVRTVVGAQEVRIRTDTIYADHVAPDTAMATLVARYTPQTDSAAQAPLARLRVPLPARPEGNAILPMLVADAWRTMARTDAALAPVALFAGDGFPAGTVRGRDVAALLTVSSPLLKLTLTGLQLREVLEQVLERGRPGAAISGLVVRWDSLAPLGRRVREIRLPAGRRVEDRATLTLAVPEVALSGGAGYARLGTLPREATGITEREALMQYLRRLPQPAEPADDRRWISEGK